MCVLGKLLDLRKNGGFKVQFLAIRAVEVDADSIEGRLEGFLGSRVHHFVSNLGIIGDPANEDELGGGSSVGGFKVEVDEGVGALSVFQLIAEIVVGGLLGSLSGNANGGIVLDGV